ncbi:zinc-binding alcohol dehydrogenase family protein [Pseudomonas sp. P66]|jgi:zinc-binding alcohol dehydrogenase family protein|uniref:Zinc-type alcohol dehydrogenase-like protein n=1 Tax=Pseudomonas arcuscaelestis TaxID=2710591 RepID=A0ABS2BTR1_9PSED|nr:zinc-binding alcohol dehydrogenase family protein [Pseudomonas arcuscaelestis]MBM3104450.1 zinc-binding alcohol dehydrogenase family protein [Pseudomonas arcuscaelestis]MBM5456973.1 zinc-binding alcohol dehydrogenase family protein [Pseudomonas arcuscaelestis]
MKVITFTQNGLPIEDPESLQDAQAARPAPGPNDLLVEVRAVSVNPVDTKVRAGTFAKEPKILGWDAAGIVREVGSAVSLFRPGDEVFYAGSIARDGSYSEFQRVDQRIVGRKPHTLSAAQAAALPLTSITAWELLFDRLGVAEGAGEGDSLLIVGAAGGVGSMLVQLARKLTKLTVIGTASRPETADWVRDLGAHFVVDHTQPLLAQLQELGVGEVSHVASLNGTEQHFLQLVEVLRPQGRLGVIDDPQSLDVMPLKRKSLSLHWELMFTRSLYETPDMIAQHVLLNRIASLIDEGVLRTTLGEHFGPINAANMRRAHALVESGKAKGKIVLEGF